MENAVLQIHFVDKSEDMVEAWRQEFANTAFVDISSGDILAHRADAIVSPANSFGFMDGGIDLAYSYFFGWGLQERLQNVLREEHFGELPVGRALVVETMHPEIPYLICAPTMRMPGNVARTPNAYLAFRAALIAVWNQNKLLGNPITSILAPGLGTGVGEMPPKRAARQMRAAYEMIVAGRAMKDRNPGALWAEHQHLLM